MELAALATRAVPGLSPTGVADAPDDARDFTAAVVVDGEGNRWRVRGPQHAQAAMRLETEVQVLRGFSTSIRAELSFRVPSVAGATRVDDMRVFVYNHLPGSPVELPALTKSSSAELIEDLGRTVAAVHQLSEAVVDHAELPRYTAERLRQRRLNELDAAAATGEVPPLLLRRWEHAMEDKQLWNFTPTVVHGDLHEDNLLIEGERVVAVTGWTDLHIGDPADDLAWLIASPQQSFADAVLAAYTTHLGDVGADEHLMRRAALSAEFALAQWLVRGQAGENQQMVEEAKGLLSQLASDIDTYGGRAISVDDEDDDVESTGKRHDSQPVMRPGAAATVAADAAEDDEEPAVITDATAEDDDAAAGGEASAGSAVDEGGAVEGDDAHDSGSPASAATAGAQAAEPAEPATPAGSAEPAGPVSSIGPEELAEPGEFPAEEQPTGELPIHPDEASEQRAKQKNFFPASSARADASEQAESFEGTASTASASDSIASHSTLSENSAAEEAAGTAEPEDSAEDSAGNEAENEAADDSATRDAVYSRHPGLRPPE